jgi:hypothetical protein
LSNRSVSEMYLQPARNCRMPRMLSHCTLTKWLADRAPHRERRMRSCATKKRLRHLSSGGVVSFGYRFRNYGTCMLSRPARRSHHGDGRETRKRKTGQLPTALIPAPEHSR